MKRYLLCRPAGGLNDTLVQISWCVFYAKRFDRELILDTSTSGLGCDFGDLFDVANLPVKTTMYSEFSEVNLNTLESWPSSIQGRIDSYTAIGLVGKIGLYEAVSLQKISFWAGADYSPQLLVHHGGGGGTSSKRLLRFLSLRPEVAEVVEKAMVGLPEKYDAVHIRNTDYPSAWDLILARVSQKADQELPIVVFSDDPQVLARARAIDSIFLPSPLQRPRTFKGPLHKQLNLSNAERRELAVEMITELAAMSAARNFYFSRTRGRNGSPKSPTSGFSRLVESFRMEFTREGALGINVNRNVGGTNLGKNIRVRVFSEDRRAILKFLRFYYLRLRSGVGRLLGR